jgi:hypothetical protein
LSEEFDDPDLKRALKRAWGNESAPASLRFRVSAAMIPRQAIGWRSNRFQTLALAASILILIGAFVVNDAWLSTRPVTSLPVFAAAAFVTTHDGCCKVINHQHVPPRFSGEMATTGQWLSSQAHVAVIAVDMGDGWVYRGAAPCPVSGNRSGHLLFKRGSQCLSIFSIPAAELNVDPADHEYSINAYQGHTLAAFTRNGGLYCIVANDPNGAFGPDQVQSVRDDLIKNFSADSFAAVAGATPRPPPLATLLDY